MKAKAILSYQGRSTAPTSCTTLNWIIGGFLTLGYVIYIIPNNSSEWPSRIFLGYGDSGYTRMWLPRFYHGFSRETTRAQCHTRHGDAYKAVGQSIHQGCYFINLMHHLVIAGFLLSGIWCTPFVLAGAVFEHFREIHTRNTAMAIFSIILVVCLACATLFSLGIMGLVSKPFFLLVNTSSHKFRSLGPYSLRLFGVL